MARVLAHDFADQAVCAYLPDRPASQEHKIILDVTPEELQGMLERGWRRFGAIYFRPACAHCMECVSLRIPVKQFVPSRSQRRVMRKCSRLRVESSAPYCDEEHLALYRRWHANREAVRGWPRNPIDTLRYQMDFCFPHPSARELTWYDGDRLIAVDLLDETPAALSSIFFFFDPDFASLSPGIASVLFEIEWARHKGLSHVYLGYRVSGCGSMTYKARFQPHELLVGRPEPDEAPLWKAGEESPTSNVPVTIR